MKIDNKTQCFEYLKKSIHQFITWLDAYGYESHDPYDIWGTSYGLFARKRFYQGDLLGKFMVAPVVLADLIAPGIIRMGIEKKRFATADAQIALGFLNLFESGIFNEGLDRGEKMGDQIMAYSVKGYSGLSWGYPFDWQSNKGLWKKNTPFITTTPYCFELFVKLHEITHKQCYKDVAESIGRFIYQDLNHTPHTRGCAGSYSPLDATKVINASAYRAWALREWYEISGCDEGLEHANDNLEFILESQNIDGSWWYALENDQERFIDHFHTCFVLKNLIKIEKKIPIPELTNAIDRGYEYYVNHLFDSNRIPIPFSIKPRLQIVKTESYAMAEAITLNSLMSERKEGSFEFAHFLTQWTCENLQTRNGYFITRSYIWGLKARYPFLRWPQAQMFFAFTNLLLQSTRRAQVSKSMA